MQCHVQHQKCWGHFPPDSTKPCREEEPEYCTVGGWRWPGASDWHGPGSVSSTESLERPHHTELPKQLLCLWGEKGSIWLKNGSLKTTTGLHVGLERTTRVTEPSAWRLESSSPRHLQANLRNSSRFRKERCPSSQAEVQFAILPKTCCQHTKYLHLHQYELQHVHNKEC